jgi:tRNA threonylcarbamoyladenosine biosynthesis protein TsaB
MIVLGFDTATEATAVGLRLADGSTLQALDDPPPGERPGHATRLLPLAHELLTRAGVGWSELERIAVGVGPGTFTGLRIGVSTARGLAQSLDVPLVGVSSLRALAFGAVRRVGEEMDGLIAVIDARRGEVFASVYRAGERSIEDRGAEPLGAERPSSTVFATEDVEELLGPAVLAPNDLALLLERIEAGERPRRPLAVGDGAVRYRDHLEAGGIVVAPEESPLHRVGGEAICALAARAQPQDSRAVVPDYLRRPDAELALEGARA